MHQSHVSYLINAVEEKPTTQIKQNYTNVRKTSIKIFLPIIYRLLFIIH